MCIRDSPLIVHISHFEQIYELVRAVPESAKKLADRFWPGPLTDVYKRQLPEYPVDLFVNKKSKTNLENSVTMLEAAIAEQASVSDWQLETIHDQLIAWAQRLEVKNGTLLWPCLLYTSL